MFSRSQADQEYNLRLAAKVRALGIDVYCPNESEPINNKERPEITAQMIYRMGHCGARKLQCCALPAQRGFGNQLGGGIFRLPLPACRSQPILGDRGSRQRYAFKSAPHPDKHGVENQAGNANALVIGGFQQSLGVYLYESEVLDRLVEIASQREGA